MAIVTSFDRYEAAINTVFTLTNAGGEDEGFVLRQATKTVDTDTHLTFSLLFEGPPQRHPQGSYRLRHDQLKEIELFLVPVGLIKRGGVQYEAVFNLVNDS